MQDITSIAIIKLHPTRKPLCNYKKKKTAGEITKK